MPSPNTILLRGSGIGKEATAAAAGILPGHIIMLNSAGAALVSTALAGRVPRLVVRENELLGKEIETAYANGDNLLYYSCGPGVEIYAVIPANAAAIVAGDYLELDGAGRLRKYTMPTASVSGQSGATGNITVTAKTPGPRPLRYVQNDAGTASVTVSGNTITVTPATGANTADAVKAQIEANAAANALISVVSGGAGEPGISTGVDLVGAGGAEPFAVALEAVDNSAVAATGRIRALLL